MALSSTFLLGAQAFAVGDEEGEEKETETRGSTGMSSLGSNSQSQANATLQVGEEKCGEILELLRSKQSSPEDLYKARDLCKNNKKLEEAFYTRLEELIDDREVLGRNFIWIIGIIEDIDSSAIRDPLLEKVFRSVRTISEERLLRLYKLTAEWVKTGTDSRCKYNLVLSLIRNYVYCGEYLDTTATYLRDAILSSGFTPGQLTVIYGELHSKAEELDKVRTEDNEAIKRRFIWAYRELRKEHPHVGSEWQKMNCLNCMQETKGVATEVVYKTPVVDAEVWKSHWTLTGIERSEFAAFEAEDARILGWEGEIPTWDDRPLGSVETPELIEFEVEGARILGRGREVPTWGDRLLGGIETTGFTQLEVEVPRIHRRVRGTQISDDLVEAIDIWRDLEE